VAAKRTRTVAVRLDESEALRLRAAAYMTGRVQMGRFVREAALAFVDGDSGPSRAVVDVDVNALRSELIRVGSNLNQAVKLSHVDGQVDRLEPAVERCRRELGRLADELEKVSG
jgi:hypothetical protein